MSKAFDDANDCAEGDNAQEALVLDDFDDLVFCVLGLGLVVHATFFRVLDGGLGSFGVTLGCGLRIEGVAMEEVLGSSAVDGCFLIRWTHVGDGAQELDGCEHIR